MSVATASVDHQAQIAPQIFSESIHVVSFADSTLEISVRLFDNSDARQTTASTACAAVHRSARTVKLAT